MIQNFPSAVITALPDRLYFIIARHRLYCANRKYENKYWGESRLLEREIYMNVKCYNDMHSYARQQRVSSCSGYMCVGVGGVRGVGGGVGGGGGGDVNQGSAPPDLPLLVQYWELINQPPSFIIVTFASSFSCNQFQFENVSV